MPNSEWPFKLIFFSFHLLLLEFLEVSFASIHPHLTRLASFFLTRQEGIKQIHQGTKMNSKHALFQGIRICSSTLSRRAVRTAGSRSISQLISQPPRRSLQFQPLHKLSAPCNYVRCYSSSPSDAPRPLTDTQSDQVSDAEREEENRKRREQEPAYQITFTCKPCGQRSSHRMSKQGYHHGTVLISCPSCKNRHVISDHLNIFFDKKSTLEDILQEQGKALTKGYLDGDVEFWDDGTVRKSDSPS